MGNNYSSNEQDLLDKDINLKTRTKSIPNTPILTRNIPRDISVNEYLKNSGITYKTKFSLYLYIKEFIVKHPIFIIFFIIIIALIIVISLFYNNIFGLFNNDISDLFKFNNDKTNDKIFQVFKIILIIFAIISLLIIFVFFPQIYDLIKNIFFSKSDDKKKDYFILKRRLQYLLLLVTYTIIIILLYVYDPFKIISTYFGPLIIVSIFFATFVFIILSYYQYSFGKEDQYRMDKKKPISPFDIIKTILFFIIGFSISGLIIYLMLYFLGVLSSKINVLSLFLNILIVIVVLIIFYKFLFKNKFFNEKVLNILLFIPYLLSTLIGEIKSGENNGYIILIGIIFILVILNYLVVYFENKSIIQGGKLLINTPVDTYIVTNLGSYKDLNGINPNYYEPTNFNILINQDPTLNIVNINYQYGISCWINIKSMPPNTNSSYSKFVEILSYTTDIKVIYKADTNILRVVVTQPTNLNNDNIDLDENSYRIIYETKNFLLQKWNHIFINYNGGTLDIFINGDLLKTANNVIPRNDGIFSVGYKDGIVGQICNVIYFKKPLMINQIKYLYNTNKNKNPPVPFKKNLNV